MGKVALIIDKGMAKVALMADMAVGNAHLLQSMPWIRSPSWQRKAMCKVAL